MQVDASHVADIIRVKRSSTFKLPRSHQDMALNTLFNASKKQDRYTCVMACGAGKTLVGLWHAEQLQARKILVLLPSLGLINQTLHEWLHNTSLSSLRYLCVCSDLSVDSDEDLVQYRTEELDFQVTTQSSEVAQFLNACTGNDTVVIFSTYHSASVVGKGLDQNSCFDLIIFDEAHKTAGEVGKAFSYALYDKNITAVKRLFMTATPRVLNHYHVNRNNKSNIKNHYISMCDQSLYGPIAYSLNFKKAVELGIIVDYKIIISVVTSEIVDSVLRKANVKFKNKKIDALTIAHMLSIQHAAQKHGIKKLITFHSNVKSAESFNNYICEHGFNILEDFNAFHVNGKMSAAKRSQYITVFKNSNNGILTNARCLTEGIDVPIVDMVAFLCNKRSRIDIVQATGRVMRRAPGKQMGYILLPFYIKHDHNNIQKSLENLKYVDYADIWHILKILNDYDDSLNDIINTCNERIGEFDSVEHAILQKKIVVDSPNELEFDLLKDTIKTLSVEILGDPWSYQYGVLKKFKRDNKHCNPSPSCCENIKLVNWVIGQRYFYKKGDLSPERIEKLNSLGFIWNPYDAQWDGFYDDLVSFKRQHGHCCVSARFTKNKFLKKWALDQRALYRKGKLSEDRIDKLNKLQFVWDIYEYDWQEKYEALKEFFQENGHCNLPVGYCSHGLNIYTWLHCQYKLFSDGNLSDNKIKKLVATGIDFYNRKRKVAKNKRFELGKFKEALLQYKMIHGNCYVSQRVDDELYYNAIKIRKLYRENKLKEEDIVFFEKIGFNLEIDRSWMMQYELMVDYYNQNGHCDFSSSENKNLYGWKKQQLVCFRKNKLTKSKLNLLEKIGFPWKRRVARPHSYYIKKLERCYNENGKVELNFLDLKTRKWLERKRGENLKKIIDPDIKSKIEKYGNLLDPVRNNMWDNYISMLIDFKKEHGTMLIFRGVSQYKNLYAWTASVRLLKKQGKLSHDRESQLNELGFIWDTENYKWDIYFEKAKNVIRDPNFSSTMVEYGWLNNQKVKIKKGRLSKDKIDRLKSLGISLFSDIE